MEEHYDRPVSRDDLLFTVEMALRKARRLWPKKRVPSDHDRLKPAAKAVVKYFELCGMRCFMRAPERGHSTQHSRSLGRAAAGGPARMTRTVDGRGC